MKTVLRVAICTLPMSIVFALHPLLTMTMPPPTTADGKTATASQASPLHRVVG